MYTYKAQNSNTAKMHICLIMLVHSQTNVCIYRLLCEGRFLLHFNLKRFIYFLNYRKVIKMKDIVSYLQIKTIRK